MEENELILTANPCCDTINSDYKWDADKFIEEARARKEAADKEKARQDNLLKQLQSQRDELKSLFNKLGNPQTASGISNYDRKLVEAINGLSTDQVTETAGCTSTLYTPPSQMPKSPSILESI